MENNNNQQQSETKRVPSMDELRESGKIPRSQFPPDPEPDFNDEPYDGYDDSDYEDNEPEQMITRSRRKSSGIIGGLMYFLLVICVSVILASLLWMAANDVLSLNKEYAVAEIEIPALPYDKNTLISLLSELEITPPANATIDDLLRLFAADKRPNQPFDLDALANKLKDEGIITHPALFKFYVKFAKADRKMQPGTYEVTSLLDYHALTAAMRRNSGARLIVKGVMFPEGYTLAQTFALLEEKKVCTAEKLWEASANYDFKYDFLKGLPKGDKNRLEGFLFPDTYEFFQNSAPEEALKIFLDNFGKKFTPEMIAEASEQGKTVKDVLTVASLIEREAADDKERPTIASVIYNRLEQWDYPLLQIDASVMYALPEHKGVLTYDDLQVDSPYNLYKYAGLPPGPIANPGLASIKAALEPETTEWFFYALDKTYKHRFFKTTDEHAAFVASPDFVNN